MAGHNTTSLHSTLSLTHGNKEAEEQKPECLCAILKPEPFDVVNGGSYRCVTPKTLLSSLKKVEDIMQREGFLWTKIKFGLELTFYIHLQCCCGDDFVLSGVEPTPDSIEYDGKNSAAIVMWKLEI